MLMKVIEIYVSISLLTILLSLIMYGRVFIYIIKHYRNKSISNAIHKLIKDLIQAIIKSIFPFYHLIIAFGLFAMIMFDDVELNLTSMGFDFIECKFKQD